MRTAKTAEELGWWGGFGLDEGGEEGGGGALALSGDEKAEEGVGMGEEMVGAEEVGHGGVGIEGEAEGGVEGGLVEEGEGREGEGVEGGDVGGGEGREEGLEGGMEGALVGVLDGLGERNEELRGSASGNGGDWMGKRERGGGARVGEEEGRAEGRETDCRRAEAEAEEEEAQRTRMTMTGATNSALVSVPYGNKS